MDVSVKFWSHCLWILSQTQKIKPRRVNECPVQLARVVGWSVYLCWKELIQVLWWHVRKSPSLKSLFNDVPVVESIRFHLTCTPRFTCCPCKLTPVEDLKENYQKSKTRSFLTHATSYICTWWPQLEFSLFAVWNFLVSVLKTSCRRLSLNW